MQADQKKPPTLHSSQCKEFGPGNLKILVRQSPFSWQSDQLPLEIPKSIMDLAGSDTSFGFGWGKFGFQQDSTMHIFHFLGGSMGLTQVELCRCWNIWCCNCKYLEYLSLTIQRREIGTPGRGMAIYFFFEIKACWLHNTMKDLDIDRRFFIRAYDGSAIRLCNPRRLSSLELRKHFLSVDLETWSPDENGKPTGALKEDGVASWWSLSPMIALRINWMELRKGLSMRLSGITQFINASGFKKMTFAWFSQKLLLE